MLSFDFTQFYDIEFAKEFKEDSVREFIISPLLKELGFKLKDSKENKLEIRLSQTLTTATILGSNKKIEAKDLITPDYVLYVDSKPHCVLDAKALHISIESSSKAERQVFYYAINKEIKASYYALCNGKNFIIFSTNGQEILESFSCKELFENENKLKLLKQYLTTPIQSLKQTLNGNKIPKKPDSWYLQRELPKAILNPKKRINARHFGCTGYFTKQSWDVVERHIKTFSDEGDVVLDSFGGSGVTAIEAMMNGRVGIHTDLNPLSIFMVKALSAECDLDLLYTSTQEIIEEFEALRPKSEKEVKEILKNAKYYPNALDSEFGWIASQKEQDSILWIPRDEILPKGSDVDSVLKLFSKRQLVELAILRRLIFKKTTPSGNKANRIRKRALRYSLMLAFYSVISDVNLTYHKSHTGGGNSGIFRYYRYRIAKEPTEKLVIKTFQQKIKRVVNGKAELKNSPYFYNTYHKSIERVIKDFNGAMLKDRSNLDRLDSIESIIYQAHKLHAKFLHLVLHTLSQLA